MQMPFADSLCCLESPPIPAGRWEKASQENQLEVGRNRSQGEDVNNCLKEKGNGQVVAKRWGERLVKP